MEDFFFIVGLSTCIIAATAAVVGFCIWIERQVDKSLEFTHWKNRVSDSLFRIESACSRLESQARKSQKPKPGAKRK